MEQKKTRTRATKPTISQATTEPKKTQIKLPAADYSKEFIALQIKAENIVDQYLDLLSERLKEKGVVDQVTKSMQAYNESVLTLQGLGLINPYRQSLIEPEVEEIKSPETITESAEKEGL